MLICMYTEKSSVIGGIKVTVINMQCEALDCISCMKRNAISFKVFIDNAHHRLFHSWKIVIIGQRPKFQGNCTRLCHEDGLQFHLVDGIYTIVEHHQFFRLT